MLKKILKRILIVVLCLWIYQTYFRYIVNYSGGTVLVVDRLTGKGYELSRLDGLFPLPYGPSAVKFKVPNLSIQ